MRFRDLLASMRGMKHYFIAACLTMAIGIWYGYESPDKFNILLTLQEGRLEGIAQSIGQAGHKQLLLFLFILLNNWVVSMAGVYFGAFFMIFPLFLLVSNGLLIGYLAEQSLNQGHLTMFLKAVLPHGIIEIPAILLASAYGIRFGTNVLRLLFVMPFPGSRRRAAIHLVAFMRVTIPLIPVLTGLLLLAAIIESTFTVWFIGK